MPRPLRVFLCHASQDKPAVRKLHRYLKQHGIEPWLDEIDLLPGENWEVEIPRAIDDSDVILVCLSKNSINKEGYVQREISFALDKALEKPEGTIFIIPAKLEDCEVPKRLNRFQWVDLFRPDSNKRLLLGLNKRALSLGSDMSSVILEDTRQRKPAINPVESDSVDREALEGAQGEAAERLVREKVDQEKTSREKAEYDAAEKAEREKRERETAERLVREQSEREAREKIAREKAEQDKQERENVQLPVGRVGNPTIKTDEETSRAASPTYKDAPALVVEKKRESAPTPAPKLNTRLFGVGGIVLACLVLTVFGGNYLFNQIDSPITTIPASATEFIADIIESSMPDPKKTFTPAPPNFTPTSGIASTKNGEDGMTLVFVPAGEFTMGEGSDAHEVILDAFWIDQTEVTNAMYAKCVAEDGCTPPLPTSSYTHDSYYGNSEFDDSPVIYVDWNQANAYCVWAGRKLPTEAEWEKASRGTDGRTYPWGEEISCKYANYFDGITFCVGDTAPVRSYPDGASIYGALDMAGNVWEWVSSLYQDYPYDATDGREDLTVSGLRVLRGGSWNDNDLNVRSSARYGYFPLFTYNYLGFRCSLSP